MIDNPMVSGLRQLEEKQDAYQKRNDAARDEAEERLLLDMDTFSAWLTEQCYLTSPVQFPAIPQDPADMQILIESMDVPALLAASIHPFARVRLRPLMCCLSVTSKITRPQSTGSLTKSWGLQMNERDKELQDLDPDYFPAICIAGFLIGLLSGVGYFF